MNNKLQIGLMMPYSSVYPIGKLFKRGLKDVLDNNPEPILYEIHSEFVGSASVDEVKRASDKFTSYIDADYITGIVNSLTIEDASKTFDSDVQYRFANLGEHLFKNKSLSDNIKISTVDLWKDVYALASYALDNISKNGAYAASFYDTGYSFAQMIDVALKNRGRHDFLPLYVSKMPPPGQLSNVEEVVDRIEKDMPSWVFAAFCGKEAIRFLKYWKQRGLHKHIKLLGLPFLADNDHLKDIEIATCSNFLSESGNDAVSKINTDFSTVFYELGKKVGQSIVENHLGYHKASIKNNPRKLLTLKYLENEKFTYDGIENSPSTINLKNKYITQFLEQPTSAWQNPYMCV